MVDDGVAELRAATEEAWHAVARMRDRLRDMGSRGVLDVLGERVAALLDEFAWEVGLIDLESTRPGARLDHVGVVVSDLRAAATLYGDLLGGTLVAGGWHEGMGIRTLHFAYPGGSRAFGKVELLQPVRPGPIARFLEARGGGLHHLTFFTPDLTASINGFEAAGLVVVDVDRTAPEWHEAYLSPRSTQGCLIQVVVGDDLKPIPGITVDAVLRNEWEWRNHRPQRVMSEVRQ